MLQVNLLNPGTKICCAENIQEQAFDIKLKIGDLHHRLRRPLPVSNLLHSYLPLCCSGATFGAALVLLHLATDAEELHQVQATTLSTFHSYLTLCCSGATCGAALDPLQLAMDAMKDNEETKIILKPPRTDNFAGVEYFRVFRETRDKTATPSCRQVNPGATSLTSRRLHFSLPSFGPRADSPPPALSRSSPVPPLLCAVGHVRRRPALGVAGLDSCVIPFLFLQRPLILWEVFTTQDSHDTCSLSTSSDCSSRDWDKTPSTRTHRGKLFLNFFQ